jgi:hypothetical protein
MTLHPLLFALALALAGQPERLSVTGYPSDYVMIGKLGLPLGTAATIEGRVVLRSGKTYDDGPNLLVQAIDGVRTQEDLLLPLRADPKLTAASPSETDAQAQARLFHPGAFVRVRAYENGEFAGTVEGLEGPDDGAEVSQGRPYFFTTRLVVGRIEPIGPLVDSPSDFVGRRALVAGLAANVAGKAAITGVGFTLLLPNAMAWPASSLGKPAEATGVVESTPNPGVFTMAGVKGRLSRLDDMVGRVVTLRATRYSQNDRAWVVYRGANLLVERSSGWEQGCPSGPVSVTGHLTRAKRDRDALGLLAHGPQLVLDGVSCTPLSETDRLLAPEIGDSER